MHWQEQAYYYSVDYSVFNTSQIFNEHILKTAVRYCIYNSVLYCTVLCPNL
jgi:hypothetical protein